MNITSVLSHYPLRSVQSEARSLSNSLRGEKWLKDVGSDFWCDSRTIVANLYNNMVFVVECSDPQLTLAVHSIDGILNKVGPNLVELSSERIHQKRNWLVLAPHSD